VAKEHIKMIYVISMYITYIYTIIIYNNIKAKNKKRQCALINKARRRSAEAAWSQEPAFVRPQTEGEQPQARGTITMKRPSGVCRACRWIRTKISRLTVGFGREDENAE